MYNITKAHMNMKKKSFGQANININLMTGIIVTYESNHHSFSTLVRLPKVTFIRLILLSVVTFCKGLGKVVLLRLVWVTVNVWKIVSD